jgi:signal transduction histidine kinase
MDSLYFSVDAALLRELGERLVGKPHIALAELVKNGYDADATEVTIKVYPEKDLIEVQDTGNGMDRKEFEDFWMRIGSTHKEKLKKSKHFERPMTGSKGVGRLSVQFLASKLELQTTSEKNLKKTLIANVDWDEAVKSDLLTRARVDIREEIRKESDPSKKGTTIILSGLKHDWKDEKFVSNLAKEIWWLQPPFRKLKPGSKISDTSQENTFDIKFESSNKKLTDEFNWQIHAIMDTWNAKLVGRCTKGKLNLALEFSGKKAEYYSHEFPNCKFKEADFEIRIFSLNKRQPYGIKLAEARDYLEIYGGIHVYDGGFHLPYYGLKENDWLKIEHDHAMRTRTSKLLPEELRFHGGSLSFLPNLSRVFGVVNVDTSKEDKETGLKILITRDRLQGNTALDDLVVTIRWAMDLYANEEAKRSYEEQKADSDIESPKEKFERVEEVLAKYRNEIPDAAYSEIQEGIRKVTIAVESEAEKMVKKTSLLGPLATAGISSLAFQHELKRQFRSIEDIVFKIDQINIDDKESQKALLRLKEDLISWVESARATNALFTYLADSDNIKTRKRFKAKNIIEDIKDQVRILGRGVSIETDRIDENLLMPKATFPEWSSIFQNVFLNAFNAVLDSEKKIIEVSSRFKDGYHEILVQDTGSGVDLADSENLFEPFVRKLKISPERQALGYGGTGLGLTIVNLVANNIGCKVSFVKPDLGFKTAFSIKWRESK